MLTQFTAKKDDEKKKSLSLVDYFKSTKGQFSSTNETQEQRELYLRVSTNYKDDVGNDTDIQTTLDHAKIASKPGL